MKKRRKITNEWINKRLKKSTWYASGEFFKAPKRDPIEIKIKEEEDNFTRLQRMTKEELTGFGKDG
jgi:hypothetical protein